MQKKTVTVLLVILSLVISSFCGMMLPTVCTTPDTECDCDIGSNYDASAWITCPKQPESARIPKGESIDLGEIYDYYAEDGEFNLQNKYGEAVYTTGNQFVEFTNLVHGVTYQFSTCSRFMLTYDTKWDTVLVLRDPFGNELTNNNDCDMDDTNHQCSYVFYRHDSDDWNNVFLSIYTGDNIGDCFGYFPSQRMGVPIFYSIITIEPCADEYLRCFDASFEVYYPDGYNDLAFDSLNDLTSYDLCDDDVLEFSVDGGETFYSVNSDWYDFIYYLYYAGCDFLGDNEVIFKIYAQTCTSNLTIGIYPYDMYNYETITGGIPWPVILSPLVINHCRFGNYPCPIDYDESYIIPPVYVVYENLNGGCGFLENLHFDAYIDSIEPSPNSPYDLNVFLGDAVNYDIEGYLEDAPNSFGSITTTSQFNGIQIYSMQSKSTLDDINNDGIMYLNSEYYVNFASYISETVNFNGFYFAFYNGGALTDPDSYLTPKYVDSNVGESSPGYWSGTFEIGFTLDTLDANYIEPGSYQLIVYTPYTFDNFSPADGYSQIYFPSHQSDTSIYDLSKRGTPLNYIVSFANPTVQLQLLYEN